MTHRLRTAALVVPALAFALSVSACASEEAKSEKVASAESPYAYVPDESTTQDYWNDWDSPESLDPFRVDDGWGNFGFGGGMDYGACRTTLETINTQNTDSIEEARRIMEYNASSVCRRSSAANAFTSCEVASATVSDVECTTDQVWDDEASSMAWKYRCTGTITCSRRKW